MAAVHENRQLLKTPPVRYYSLSSTQSFRLQGCYVSGTSKARLHGLLGRTSMYETFLIITMQGSGYREEKDKERGWWKIGRQGRGVGGGGSYRCTEADVQYSSLHLPKLAAALGRSTVAKFIVSDWGIYLTSAKGGGGPVRHDIP
jgi:hypothetical protein